MRNAERHAAVVAQACPAVPNRVPGRLGEHRGRVAVADGLVDHYVGLADRAAQWSAYGHGREGITRTGGIGQAVQEVMGGAAQGHDGLSVKGTGRSDSVAARARRLIRAEKP